MDERNELQIQTALFVKAWNYLPETRYCLYHIANEGQRSVMLLKSLQASGLLEGIQDLHFLWRGITYRMEMKDAKGYVKPDQKVIHCAHAKQGSLTYIFRDDKDAFRFMEYITIYSLTFKNELLIMQVEAQFKDFVSPWCYYENLDELIAKAEEAKKKRTASYKNNRLKVSFKGVLTFALYAYLFGIILETMTEFIVMFILASMLAVLAYVAIQIKNKR